MIHDILDEFFSTEHYIYIGKDTKTTNIFNFNIKGDIYLTEKGKLSKINILNKAGISKPMAQQHNLFRDIIVIDTIDKKQNIDITKKAGISFDGSKVYELKSIMNDKANALITVERTYTYEKVSSRWSLLLDLYEKYLTIEIDNKTDKFEIIDNIIKKILEAMKPGNEVEQYIRAEFATISAIIVQRFKDGDPKFNHSLLEKEEHSKQKGNIYKPTESDYINLIFQ